MATPLATPADLSAALGQEISDDQSERALSCLRVVSSLVRSMGSTNLDSEEVRDVVASAAARRFAARRDGLTAAGPFTYANSLSSSSFTAEEHAILRSVLGGRGSSFTLSIATPDA